MDCNTSIILAGFNEVSGSELPEFIHPDDLRCLSFYHEVRGRFCLGQGPYNQHIQVGMDGWMTCNFTSFSTVFQSYQDDGQIIMAVCNGIPFMIEKISPQAGLKLCLLYQ